MSLSSEEQSGKVLSSLKNLRDADPKLKTIRVSPDLSLQEREEVRILVQEAKNRTSQEEGDYRHIVRGKQIVRVRDHRQRNQRNTEDQKEAQTGDPTDHGGQGKK